MSRAPREPAPAPPWGAFPLVELCALGAIVLGVWGLLRGGHGGGILLTFAALLGCVAGLEVAIREHFGGFRSHTFVLSGVLVVAVGSLLLLTGVERAAVPPISLGVLVAGVVGFRTLFKRRSGGVAVRVR
jgi:hypothetical protein